MECINSIDDVISKRLKEKVESMRHILEDPFPGTVEGYWDKTVDGINEKDLKEIDRHFNRLVKKL